MARFDQSLLHKQQIAPGYNIIFYGKIVYVILQNASYYFIRISRTITFLLQYHYFVQ